MGTECRPSATICRSRWSNVMGAASCTRMRRLDLADLRDPGGLGITVDRRRRARDRVTEVVLQLDVVVMPTGRRVGQAECCGRSRGSVAWLDERGRTRERERPRGRERERAAEPVSVHRGFAAQHERQRVVGRVLARATSSRSVGSRWVSATRTGFAPGASSVIRSSLMPTAFLCTACRVGWLRCTPSICSSTVEKVRRGNRTSWPAVRPRDCVPSARVTDVAVVERQPDPRDVARVAGVPSARACSTAARG